MHSVERIYLQQRCFDASKPRVAASTGPQYQYVHGVLRAWGFPDVIKCHVAALQCIRCGRKDSKKSGLRHPDYDPDLAQKLISLSMFRRLSTRNIFIQIHARVFE